MMRTNSQTVKVGRALRCAPIGSSKRFGIVGDDVRSPFDIKGLNVRLARSGVHALPNRGFTLIELILVLALLTIVTSLAAPSLLRFFRGRTLESEARQLLSLTHAARSRAISEGFPVVLWIDSQQRAYGMQLELSSQTGNQQDTDSKAEEFSFDDTLQIDAINASPTTVNGRTAAAIRFMPDGEADENSPKTVRLLSHNGDVLWLIQATNRLSYEIRNSDK